MPWILSEGSRSYSIFPFRFLVLIVGFFFLGHPSKGQILSYSEEAKQNLGPLLTGADQTHIYLPKLKGKKVALVVNPTSTIGRIHLVDTLLNLGISIVKVFGPEHGFRGDADAGEKVKNGLDSKTNLPVISLYGKNKKPSSEQ